MSSAKVGLSPEKVAYDRRVIDRRAGAPRSGPLPDEALDALVTVLDEIRFGRSSSRSELVERTGLGRAIVAQRVSELIERGLVSEGEVGPSTGGRPPRRLTFRADGGHVLVADLGATSIDVAVTSLDGRILGHHGEPAHIEAGPERCLDRVDVLFDTLLQATEGLTGRLWGVGIAVPGPVEFEAGRPISPPIMPGWDDYPIRERFAERYRAPVWVDNDVNVLALGEWRSGIAAGHDNVVVVKIGTGIGAGIISDGRLHRGAQGSAGDVGHIQVVRRPDGHLPLRQHRLPRGAGRRWRASAGRARRPPATAGAPGSRSPSTSAGRSRRRMSRGPHRPAIRSPWRSSSRPAGGSAQMLAGIVNFFNPSLIVIGGGVANSPDQLLAAIREIDLPPLAAAGHPRAAHPPLVTRRPGRRHRGLVDGRRPAVRTRVDRPLDRGRRPGRFAGVLARTSELTDDPAVEHRRRRTGITYLAEHLTAEGDGRAAGDAVLSRTTSSVASSTRVCAGCSPRATARTSSAAATAIS